MGFLFLVALALVIFGSFGFVYKLWCKDAAYVIAIGGAVSANIFHIGSYPINVGQLIFGIDSVIYTGFIFCVVILLLDCNLREARKLMYCSMGSIFFAAIVQFVANWAVFGAESDVVWGLVSCLVSMLATYVALEVVFLLDKSMFSRLNVYIRLLLMMLVASLVNSFIYFGGVAVFNGLGDNFGFVLLASYIGKAMSMLFALGAYCVSRRLLKPENSDSAS